MEQLFLSLGYLGAFASGFASTITLFLPVPSFITVFIMAGFLNPLLIGLLGGIGAAIGEIVGYAIGYGGKECIVKYNIQKIQKKINKIQKYFKKYNLFIIIFIFGATPLPFDLIGILCGSINYSFKKFFIATLLGKLVKYWLLAFAGFYGVTSILHFFGL